MAARTSNSASSDPVAVVLEAGVARWLEAGGWRVEAGGRWLELDGWRVVGGAVPARKGGG